MLKIGLTGNIGSGKSIVSIIFETLQVPVYHSDDRAKFILDKSESVSGLQKLFGKEIFDPSGKIDRKKIAGIVFNDKEKLTLLNSIIHPAVLRDFEGWAINQQSAPYIIMESAILFETGFSKLFDKIIIVTAPEKIRIERVMKRDQVSEEEIKNRIKNQLSEEDKIKDADYVVINDDEHLVIPQVLKIHEALSLPSNK